MRKLVLNEFMSLDGVAQSPGYPDEDPSGGFKHGGWHMQYMDESSGKWVTDLIASAGGLVLGRRTYEIFAAYWPTAPEEEAVIAKPLNSMPKYVASRTLSEPLAWENSTLLGKDVSAELRRLKEAEGGDLMVIGSTELAKTLLENRLVDELQLMIDPIILGGGKRIFRDDGTLRALRLVDSQLTDTGAIIATYAFGER